MVQFIGSYHSLLVLILSTRSCQGGNTAHSRFYFLFVSVFHLPVHYKMKISELSFQIQTKSCLFSVQVVLDLQLGRLGTIQNSKDLPTKYLQPRTEIRKDSLPTHCHVTALQMLGNTFAAICRIMQSHDHDL